MMYPITVISIVRIAVIVDGLYALRVSYKQAEKAEIPSESISIPHTVRRRPAFFSVLPARK